ncbi:MAG: beta-ketoacyl-ACP synthase II [Chlamydiia bacterium]|nr:beta-ketoacyl-ACP synthase II [Chlamydiia bacterium]MCB1116164.1 beta-ketoacyl-ACP synthase II [Chlamydiia bacterium]
MSKKRRVVVTGMGIVSCFGSDVDQFYQNLLEGKSGVQPITQFPCDEYPTRFAGSVKDFEVGDYMDKKQARRVDPFIRYAMVAGKKAIESAGLSGDALEALDKSRCGVLVGSGMGGMSTFSDGNKTLLDKGFNRITPFFVPFIITNMAGGLLAIDLGFTGPNYSISTACATANYSIVSAAQHIERGDADLMVCGGTEAPISPIGVAGFVVMKALSERNDDISGASRPWDKNRDGFVIGEGAGILILEEYEHAKKRGAPILAEYLGGAVSTDAYHITSPREDGAGVAACIETAIKDAGIDKAQINYINAHATATSVGDLCEVRGIRTVFGGQTKSMKMNATKSMTGHCLGAAGGVEAVATIKAIQTGKLHPTLNLKDPEEELADFNVVGDKAEDFAVTAGISNSFGFGGHNSVVIFGAPT